MFASSHMPNQTLITCVSAEIWTKPVSAETGRRTILGEYRPSEDAVFATRSNQTWRCTACTAGAAPCALRRRNAYRRVWQFLGLFAAHEEVINVWLGSSPRRHDGHRFAQPIPMEIPVDRDSSAFSQAADLTGRSATPWFSYKLLHHIV